MVEVEQRPPASVRSAAPSPSHAQAAPQPEPLELALLGLGDVLRDSPPWLISAIVHMAMMILFGLMIVQANKKDDLLLYFQSIDRGLHEVLREERAPLVLAAVDYFLPIYRQANTYSQLLEKGIEGNPDRLSDKDLHDRAWAIVEPRFTEDRQRAIGIYHQAAGTGRATATVEEIIPAAHRGEHPGPSCGPGNPTASISASRPARRRRRMRAPRWSRARRTIGSSRWDPRAGA